MPTTKSSKSSSKKRKEPSSTGDGDKKPAEKKPSEKKPKGEGSSLAPPFLLKLYDMVTQAATDEVVQWAVGGSALMVTDVQTFTAKLLPVYFKHSSMRSFTRQLNNYGFSRESELGSEATTNSVVFAHPSFREGQRHRLAEIKRGAPPTRARAARPPPSKRRRAPPRRTTTPPREAARERQRRRGCSASAAPAPRRSPPPPPPPPPPRRTARRAADDDDEDAEQANAMRKEMQVVQVQINEVESAVKASSALHEKLDELIASSAPIRTFSSTRSRAGARPGEPGGSGAGA